MKEYLITIAITWAIKTALDYGVKKSKSTKNTIDDLIFKNAQEIFNKLNPLRKFKR